MSQILTRICRKRHLSLFWIPICCYFLFGLQYFQPNMGGAGTDLPFNLIGWICIGLSLSLGFWQLYLRQSLRVSVFLLTIVLCLGLLYVPFFYGNASPQASTWYRFIAIPLLFLFLLFSLQFSLTHRARLTLIGVIFFSCCAQLGIAFYQWISPQHAFPPFGHFQQTNLMGSYLITGLACLIYIANYANFRNQRVNKIMYFSLIMISFLMGLITLELNSRGTQLSAIIVSIFTVFYALKEKKTALLLMIMSFLIGTVIHTFTQNSAQQIKNTPESFLSQYQQDYDRAVLYPQTIELISKNFLKGVGYGNFESAYTRFSAKRAAETQALDNIRYNMDHPHNEGLFWFAEGGVVAGLGILFITGMLVFRLLTHHSTHRVLVWSLFVPIGLHALIEYPFHASIAHLLVIMVFCRLFLLNNPQFKWAVPSSVLVLFRPVALLLGVSATLFGLTGLHTISLVLAYEKAGGASPEAYLHIVNPFVHYDRYWSNIMAHKAIVAANNNDLEGMQAYVDWAQKEIKHHPKQVYFENIIRLKTHLGTLETFDCEEYERIFPKKKCANLTH